MSGFEAPERGRATKVRVDGEEALLHITDRSAMFEEDGRVSGFERSAIGMAKLVGDREAKCRALAGWVDLAKVVPAFE